MNTTTTSTNFATAKTPPLLGGGLPLIGHTVDFVRDTVGLLQRAYDQCGEVAKFKLANKSIILFTGPQAHESLFRMPDAVLNPSVAYKMMVPVFGEGVAYDCEPERMTEQLHMLYPALRNERMRTYGQIVQSETNGACERLGTKGTLDVYDFFANLTSYTSSHCLLGPEFRNEMNDEFAAVYHDLEKGIVAWGYIHPYLPIPAFKRRDRARARLGEMVSEIVQRRRARGVQGEDFLQTLMDSKYKDGSALSDHEITGLLVAAMFAGHHTSSATAGWVLVELLRSPKFLFEVRQEIDGVYAEGLDVTFDSLQRLTKTDAAVREALRLHPPLFILLRAALEDCVVHGHQVAKGDWVAVSPLVSHAMGDVFTDPEVFDPERFAEPRREDKQPFAYISFGAGRHKCLGNAFALLQIKTIVAILLSRYDFSLTGDAIETDFRGLVLGVKDPCRLRYATRTDAAMPPSVEVGTGGAGQTDEAQEQAPPAGCPAHAPAQATAPSLLIEVDHDLCQGHAVCMGHRPDVFVVGDDGVLHLEHDTVDASLRADLDRAVDQCPTSALRVREI